MVTWGQQQTGGFSPQTELSSGVEKVFATNAAFAALKSNGSVVTWGDQYDGGNSILIGDRLDSGVVHIFAKSTAFAALKDNG